MQITLALTCLGFAAANPFAAQQTKNHAKAAYMGNLMRGATATANSQLRRLGDQGNYQVDISKYSVKFEKCQFVKSYDQDLADTQGASTVLATKRFVIFRLCPDSCSSCNYNYGEYLIDLESYLSATAQYFQNYQTEMCTECQSCATNTDDAKAKANAADGTDDVGVAADDDAANAGAERRLAYYYNVSCSTCYDECYKITNMEANGYLEATNFLQCKLVYDPADDSLNGLYAGPVCASSGSKIKIGVFTDSSCLFLDTTKDVDDYLVNNAGTQMKLSHALLKNTYSDTCITCLEPTNYNDNNQGNDNADADVVSEMCETLYDEAAKCELTHGFAKGYSAYSGYENQLANEAVVCDYMQSIRSGTYDETGEIIVSGAASSRDGSAATTGGQTFALSFFVIGTIGLAIYAAVLHSKLVKGKVNLSRAGGIMA
jgi:hypothetical protein